MKLCFLLMVIGAYGKTPNKLPACITPVSVEIRNLDDHIRSEVRGMQGSEIDEPDTVPCPVGKLVLPSGSDPVVSHGTAMDISLYRDGNRLAVGVNSRQTGSIAAIVSVVYAGGWLTRRVEVRQDTWKEVGFTIPAGSAVTEVQIRLLGRGDRQLVSERFRP